VLFCNFNHIIQAVFRQLLLSIEEIQNATEGRLVVDGDTPEMVFD
jgi:hypothetical protein